MHLQKTVTEQKQTKTSDESRDSPYISICRQGYVYSSLTVYLSTIPLVLPLHRGPGIAALLKLITRGESSKNPSANRCMSKEWECEERRSKRVTKERKEGQKKKYVTFTTC